MAHPLPAPTQVLQAYQRYTYSAGGMDEVPARDAFLAALCEVAVTPVAAAEEAAVSAGRAAGQASADGSQVGAGVCSPRLMPAM